MGYLRLKVHCIISHVRCQVKSGYILSKLWSIIWHKWNFREMRLKRVQKWHLGTGINIQHNVPVFLSTFIAVDKWLHNYKIFISSKYVSIYLLRKLLVIYISITRQISSRFKERPSCRRKNMPYIRVFSRVTKFANMGKICFILNVRKLFFAILSVSYKKGYRI